MNHTYRLIWNHSTQTYAPAAEGKRAGGKSGGKSRALKAMTAAVLAAIAGTASALPTGNQTVSGQGNVTTNGSTMTVTQQSQNLSMNWQGFSIANGELVKFLQPNASAIALNRIIGNDPSSIYGALQANGQVFLINPNGILFGQGAQVNVGGLVASTLNISDSDFAAGRYKFSSPLNAPAGIVNQGTLTANPGGYIALLGGQVSNQGVIQAQLGSVALAAGKAMTLDFSGNKLLNLRIDEAALGALAENKQLIQADGGTVLMTAAARDAVLDTIVNNTGIIEARTLQNQGGTIKLLGDFAGGTVKVGGTLDASAPNGGNGGFIETSGAHVKIADGTQITTHATNGQTGTWLVDPPDLTVAASGGDITGTLLSSILGGTNVTLDSSTGTVNPAGQGNININDNVSWASNNTLTLNAYNSVNVNAVITASGDYAGLTITPNYGGGSGVGTFNLGANGKINLPGASPSLNIAGNDYYVINSLQALQDLDGMFGGYVALGSDIDASATATWNGGAGFNPIAYWFGGTVDGLGHTISNLTINRPDTDNVGLFGSVYGFGADSLRNLKLAGGSITGRDYTGALVGYGDTFSLVNVHSSAAVSGAGYVGGLAGYLAGGITASSSGGSVNGSSYYTGGLAGSLISGIVDSYATGAVSGNQYVGGLAGQLSGDWNGGAGSVANSHATGSVTGASYVGGLVGYASNSSITGSYSTGAVSGTAGSNRVGGLAGEIDGLIAGSYATGAVNVDSGDYVGGLAGYSDGAITGSYATGAVSVGSGNLVGGLVGYNFSSITDSRAEGAVTVGGNGIGAGGLVGNSWGDIVNSHAQGAVSAANVSGVGGLAGGTGASISGSYATGAVTGGYQVGGLAGIVGFYGAISNSYATGAVTGNSKVGGLMGDGGGPLTNSYATGAVVGDTQVGGLVGTTYGSIGNSYATGAVTGNSKVGGLVGDLEVGLITNSHASGSVFATGSGTASAGGLVGYALGGTIDSAYATGSVVATAGSNVGGLVGSMDTGRLTNAYAGGAVTGYDNVGGLVGSSYNSAMIGSVYSYGGVAAGNPGGVAGGLIGNTGAGGFWGSIVTNAYWDTQSSGMANGVGSGSSTGMTGLTTAQSKQSSSYAGFDFVGTWFNVDGSTRPMLINNPPAP